MTPFTSDNTEGHSDTELAEFNRRYHELLATYGGDPDALVVRMGSDPHFFRAITTVGEYVQRLVLTEGNAESEEMG